MKFVPHALRLQLLVHLRGALLETEIVLLAAIDIDRLRLDLDLIFPRQGKGMVLLPVRNVDGVSEYGGQELRQLARSAQIGIELARRFGDERSALHADRAKAP